MDKNNFKLKGILCIKQKDKNGNVIDTFTKNNMIMDDGRVSILNHLWGYDSQSAYVGRFLLGVDGINSGTNTPKTFDSTRTETFSEENGDEYWYLDWEVDSSNGAINVIGEEGNPSTNSTVTIAQDATEFKNTWTFNIPLDNANGAVNRPYTEAALYLKDDSKSYSKILSMITFPIRTKDDTVEFEIVWTIQLG